MPAPTGAKSLVVTHLACDVGSLRRANQADAPCREEPALVGRGSAPSSGYCKMSGRVGRQNGFKYLSIRTLLDYCPCSTYGRRSSGQQRGPSPCEQEAAEQVHGLQQAACRKESVSITRQRRTTAIRIATICSLFVLSLIATTAIAGSWNSYGVQAVPAYDHFDSGPKEFTRNNVQNWYLANFRVCAGQAHSDGSGFYGTYDCAQTVVEKSYPAGAARLARAHNGTAGGQTIWGQTYY
jgi:hypothetical protein